MSVVEGDAAYRPDSEAAGTLPIARTVKGGLRLGDGAHQRMIVELAKFSQRAESKAAHEG